MKYIFLPSLYIGRDMFGPVGDCVGNSHLHSAPNVNQFRVSVTSVSLIEYTPVLRLRHDENGKYFRTTSGDQILHEIRQKSCRN